MKYRVTNASEGFYSLLGPIFGSRNVERVTKDRFYDDDKKEWIVRTDANGNIVSVISILNHSIKNIFSESPDETLKDLKSLYEETLQGIAPSIYRDLFAAAGYHVETHSVNFVSVTGGYYEGQDMGTN